MKRNLWVFFILILAYQGLFAQNLSNRGKEFWVGYGHNQLFSANSQDMTLYLSAEQAATVTVSVNGTTWSQTVNIPANTVNSSIVLPKTGTADCRLLAEGLNSRGVHIVSNVPIVAYAHCTGSASSGATLLLPVETYGNTYYSINSEQRYANNCYSWFFVVASQNNTVVEITPSKPTLGGRVAGVPFTVTLNKGEIFNVMGQIQSGSIGHDMTGSKIRSLANSSGECLPIGVFSGSSRTYICSSGGGDYIIQQIFPANAWGTKYLTSPTVNSANNTVGNNNIYRVAVRDPSAVVKRNGVQLTGIINNFYYEFQSNQAEYIESDKPVLVAQYMPSTGSSCGAPDLGDPEMIYLSPVEQAINRVGFYNPNKESASIVNNTYVNIIVPNAGLSTLLIDGVNSYNYSYLHPRNFAYRVVVKKLTAPSQHTITCDSPFTAITYGMASVESYGYNAGTLVNNLNSIGTIQNTYGNQGASPFTCKNTPLRFSLQVAYKPTQLVWRLSQTPNISPNTDLTVANPLPVDSSIIGGRKYYTYTVPNDYSFTDTGDYTIQVRSSHPDIDNCDQTEVLLIKVRVNDNPKSSFTYTYSGCNADTARFVGVDTTNGYTISRWLWTFDDATTDSIRTPSKLFPNTGPHPTKLRVVTQSGCIGDTTITLNTQKPTASFGANPLQVCNGLPITFTDTSKTFGNLPVTNWYWDFGNGQVLNSSNGNPVSYIYPNFGTYTVKHFVNVGANCKSDTSYRTVTVFAKPNVSFSVPLGCLPDSIAQFTNTSSSPDGQAFTSFLWNFGDPNANAGNPNTSTVQNPTHKYTAYGTYNVSLVITSVNGCKDSAMVPFTIGGFSPAITYAVLNENALCSQNAVMVRNEMNVAADSVYRVDIYWDVLNNPTVFDLDNNPATNKIYSYTYPMFTTPVTKSITIKLVVYSKGGCISEKLKTITLHARPVLSFPPIPGVCINAGSGTVAKATVTNGVAGNGMYSGPGTNSSGSFNPAVAGIGQHTIKYVFTTNGGCIDSITQTVRVFPKPVANFGYIQICLNDSTSFIDSSTMPSGTIVNRHWDFGDGTSLIRNNGLPFKKLYASPGTYNVKLFVVSDSACLSDTITRQVVVKPLPTPVFSVANENTLCSKDQVKITNLMNIISDSVKRIDIYWDFGNQPGIFQTDLTPTQNKEYFNQYPVFTSPASKVVTIKWVVYSGVNMCRSEVTKVITLHAMPLLSYNSLSSVCVTVPPFSVAQAAATNGVIGTGTYSGPGTNASGMFNPAVAGPGVHTIKYVFVTNGGCIDSISRTIRVFPQPVAKFGVTNVCENDSTRFSDTSTIASGTIASWNWSFGDGTNAIRPNGNPFNKLYPTYGSYGASLTVISDSGCASAPATKTVTVYPKPMVDFSLPVSVCLPGGLLSITNNTSLPAPFNSNISYMWDFGDGTISTVTNPQHVYIDSNNYVIKLTATTAQGCIKDTSKTFNLFYKNPVARFGISADTLCQGTETIFTDSSNAFSSTINKWQWQFGDGTSSTQQNPKKTYRSPGQFTVTLSVTTPEGCSAVTSKMVNVFVQPIVDAGQKFWVPEGKTVQLMPVVNDTTLRFVWTPSIYLNNDTILKPFVTPVFSTIYKLTAIGQGSCSASDTVSVTVLKMLNVPNAFSPNGDGINDFWNIPYLKDYLGNKVEIFNRFGQLVFTSTGYSRPWDGTRNGSPLPVGVYYFVIDLNRQGYQKITGSVTLLK